VYCLQDAEEGTYDCIIVDSSDPVGPAEQLFQKPFFEHIHRALRPGGVVCTQAESVWLHMPIITGLAQMCSEVFVGGSVSYGYTTIPTYPSGQIGFMICSKADTSVLDVREPRQHVSHELLKFYSPAMHRAAFVLPAFAQTTLGSSLTFQKDAAP
jgi:spermidine synthase